MHTSVAETTYTTCNRQGFFCGCELLVNKHVLIPRPETEELVRWAVEILTKKNLSNIIDIGSGSGCIAISLKKILPAQCTVSAIDISTDALKTATINAEKNGVSVCFMVGNILDKKTWERLPEIDCIISNPPYIPFSEKNQIDKNVVDFEPHIALFSPTENPILFYETIAELALHKNVHSIFVEIHYQYAQDVIVCFSSRGFNTSLRKDISSNDRMIYAWK